MNENREYDVFESDQRIVAHSRYYAGLMGSFFYKKLRDEKRILGVRCEKCDKVFWPPRSTCGRCFSKLSLDNMVEIGPYGTLETYTMVTYSEPVHPRQAPLIYGIIKLDGADTGMAHFIDGGAFEKLAIGIRVRPIFSEIRNGNILDIDHFEPI
jgi:uncharacterized OB-fold protein